MCKSKMSVKVSEPNPVPPTPSRSSGKPTTAAGAGTSSFSSTNPSTSYSTPSSSYNKSSSGTTSSLSSRTSLSSLRQTLPEKPIIYNFTEICAATNNFLAKKYSSSSAASWRCNLRGKDVILFQRNFRRKLKKDELGERLSVICRNHHNSIIKLLGASISGDYIYIVYDFVIGANLADCLRNSKNPKFTELSNWVSRMQIATDLAHALDYIHNNTGLNMCLVHNHIKSSSIMVTEKSLNAKICHFGTAQLCGEIDEYEFRETGKGEITEERSEDSSKSKELKRSNSGLMKFDGARGYMSPEFQSSGVASQKSDIYAFGVVILELLSGEEPMKFKFDKSSGNFVRTSVIETAREAIDGEDDGGGRLRKWVDRRLKDSFPVDVAEKVTRLALECVEMDPGKRPNMGRVAGKISKLYMKSKKWSDSIKVPDGISVSLNPR